MRLIDADALDERVYNDIPISVFGSIKKMAAVRDIIAEAPTVDAVPVVRCNDCKEWDEENHWCNIRDSYGWDYKPNDYCSYGVRKAGK